MYLSLKASLLSGESILICRENEKAKVAELVTSSLKPVSSCLVQGNDKNLGSAMKRAILEVFIHSSLYLRKKTIIDPPKPGRIVGVRPSVTKNIKT